MLLVITGRGASADSLLPVTDGQWRPPLASELFDERFVRTLTRRKGAVRPRGAGSDWSRTRTDGRTGLGPAAG
jgi:hypothetical protein